MTIKLGNLADWRVLDAKSLSFVAPAYESDKPRRVRLYVNSETGCNWYIQWSGGERFLAFVPAGLETLEFVSDGDFDLMPAKPEGAEIQYWTSESEEFWTEGDGETFSTIYERQPRNEALEHIMFQASQNQLRRDKAHADELAAIRAEVGAMNGRQSGIHGSTPAEHKEPAGPASGKPSAANAKGALNASADADADADGDVANASDEG